MTPGFAYDDEGVPTPKPDDWPAALTVWHYWGEAHVGCPHCWEYLHLLAGWQQDRLAEVSPEDGQAALRAFAGGDD